MEATFKSAYEDAVKQADEMQNAMNIITNAALKQRLIQSLAAVKEQITTVEKVKAKVITKADYEAQMVKRIAALGQALGLVTVAAKKNALTERFGQLQNSINQMTALVGNVQRPQQNNNRSRRGYR